MLDPEVLINRPTKMVFILVGRLKSTSRSSIFNEKIVSTIFNNIIIKIKYYLLIDFIEFYIKYVMKKYLIQFSSYF